MRLWLLIFVASAGVLCGCAIQCENTWISEQSGGDLGALKIVMFERSCGATTGYSTQIAVIGPDDPISDQRILFVADTNHGRARSARWGGPWARVEHTPDGWVVSYDPRARISRAMDRINSTPVHYEPMNPPESELRPE